MGIMCSVVKETGMVTFDVGVGPGGRTLYRVACWDGRRWRYTRFWSFNAARRAYKLACNLI